MSHYTGFGGPSEPWPTSDRPVQTGRRSQSGPKSASLVPERSGVADARNKRNGGSSKHRGNHDRHTDVRAGPKKAAQHRQEGGQQTYAPQTASNNFPPVDPPDDNGGYSRTSSIDGQPDWDRDLGFGDKDGAVDPSYNGYGPDQIPYLPYAYAGFDANPAMATGPPYGDIFPESEDQWVAMHRGEKAMRRRLQEIKNLPQ